MAGSGLPENVHLFILNHVESLDALEALLLLRRETRAVTADELADRLRLSRGIISRRLDGFVSAGLVTAEGSPRAYRLHPGSSLIQDLHDLAAQCARDRITVVNLIASRNLERMKSLADAFRFKGKS